MMKHPQFPPVLWLPPVLTRYPIPLADGRTGTLEWPVDGTPADARKFLAVVEALFLWEDASPP